jgi:prepilin-type N-terminal cleavage/methylation domain-containing protein
LRPLPQGEGQRAKAFTLAEVLITLAVIGIVAALTMPALIANYQKKVTAIRVKHFYSMFSQAIRLSEAENGEYKNWDFPTSYKSTSDTQAFMNKYIAPYFKELRLCSTGSTNDKCGALISTYGANYILSNGTGVAVVIAGSTLSCTIDITGGAPPNQLGKDAFYFRMNKDTGFVPFGWTNGLTRENIITNGVNVTDADGTSRHYCNKSNRYMCTALIMLDGWEIKDDYPW